MAGYANRTVTLSFPELTEEGDELIHVTVRNPKTVPVDELTPDDTKKDSTSKPLRGWYSVIARLITSWHVYDATVVGDDQPLLAEPTPENVAKLPRDIQEAIIDKLTEASGIKADASAEA